MSPDADIDARFRAMMLTFFRPPLRLFARLPAERTHRGRDPAGRRPSMVVQACFQGTVWQVAAQNGRPAGR